MPRTVKRPTRKSRKSTGVKGRKHTAKKVSSNYVRNPDSVARSSVYPSRKSFLGRTLGRAAKYMTGPIGSIALDALSTLTGSGSYSVKVNSLIHPSQSDQIPSVHNSRGCVRVQHREYLGDVAGSINFNSQSFKINPSDRNTFPWLSQLAVNFEQWKPLGMVFEFRSMSSDTQVASTTALGSIILATEYNALAPGFTTKQAMENSQFVVSTKPSESVIHPIECDLSQTPNQPLYVRSAQIDSGDARLFDLGNFQIAATGMLRDGSDQGELWVSYDIELYKPVIGNVDGEDIPFAHTFQAEGFGNCLPANPLGADGSLTVYDTESSFTMDTDYVNNTLTFSFDDPAYATAIQIRMIWTALPTPEAADIEAPTIASFVNCRYAYNPFGVASYWRCGDHNSANGTLTIVPIDFNQEFSVKFNVDGVWVNPLALDVYTTAINFNSVSIDPFSSLSTMSKPKKVAVQKKILKPKLVSNVKKIEIEEEVSSVPCKLARSYAEAAGADESEIISFSRLLISKQSDELSKQSTELSKQASELDLLKSMLKKYEDSDKRIQAIVDRVTSKKE